MSAVDVRTVEVYDLFARNKSNNEEDNFIINTGTVCNTWYGKSEHEARHVYSFYKPLFSNRNRVIAWLPVSFASFNNFADDTAVVLV